MNAPKYQAVRDDAGSWSVVGAENELPAVLDGVPQVGLTEDEARDIAATLNEMTDDEDG